MTPEATIFSRVTCLRTLVTPLPCGVAMVPLAQAALAAPISHLAIFMPRRVIYDKLWASVSLSLGRNMTVPFLKRSFFSEYLVEKMKAGYRGCFRTYVAVNNYEDHSLFFFWSHIK